MSETSTGRRKGARVRRPPPAFNSSQPPAPKSVTAAAAKGKAKVKKKLAAAKVPVPSETDPSAFMKAPQEADGPRSLPFYPTIVLDTGEKVQEVPDWLRKNAPTDAATGKEYVGRLMGKVTLEIECSSATYAKLVAAHKVKFQRLHARPRVVMKTWDQDGEFSSAKGEHVLVSRLLDAVNDGDVTSCAVVAAAAAAAAAASPEKGGTTGVSSCSGGAGAAAGSAAGADSMAIAKERGQCFSGNGAAAAGVLAPSGAGGSSPSEEVSDLLQHIYALQSPQSSPWERPMLRALSTHVVDLNGLTVTYYVYTSRLLFELIADPAISGMMKSLEPVAHVTPPAALEEQPVQFISTRPSFPGCASLPPSLRPPSDPAPPATAAAAAAAATAAATAASNAPGQTLILTSSNSNSSRSGGGGGGSNRGGPGARGDERRRSSGGSGAVGGGGSAGAGAGAGGGDAGVLATVAAQRAYDFSLAGILKSAESSGYRVVDDQPSELKVDLFQYQRSSCQWMLDHERDARGLNGYFWERREWADGGDPLWYFPLAGEFRLAEPPHITGGLLCEEMGLGKTIEVISTILANPRDGGSHSSPQHRLSLQEERICHLDSQMRVVSRATLIVVPVSLVGQWAEEIRKKTEAGALRVMTYAGTVDREVRLSEITLTAGYPGVGVGRQRLVCTAPYLAPGEMAATSGKICLRKGSVELTRDEVRWIQDRERQLSGDGTVAPAATGAAAAARRPGVPLRENGAGNDSGDVVVRVEFKVDTWFVADNDVVLTTYELLRSRPTIFRKINFHRCVLDECQEIKTATTNIAKMCQQVKASHRWMVSGTPIAGKIDSLHGELNFLQVWPFSLQNDGFWEKKVSEPFAIKDDGALELLRALIRVVMMRHSKSQTYSDGRPLVKIPARTVEWRGVDFSATVESGQYANRSAPHARYVYKYLENLCATVCRKMEEGAGQAAGGGAASAAGGNAAGGRGGARGGGGAAAAAGGAGGAESAGMGRREFTKLKSLLALMQKASTHPELVHLGQLDVLKRSIQAVVPVALPHPPVWQGQWVMMSGGPMAAQAQSHASVQAQLEARANAIETLPAEEVLRRLVQKGSGYMGGLNRDVNRNWAVGGEAEMKLRDSLEAMPLAGLQRRLEEEGLPVPRSWAVLKPKADIVTGSVDLRFGVSATPPLLLPPPPPPAGGSGVSPPRNGTEGSDSGANSKGGKGKGKRKREEKAEFDIRKLLKVSDIIRIGANTEDNESTVEAVGESSATLVTEWVPGPVETGAVYRFSVSSRRKPYVDMLVASDKAKKETEVQVAGFSAIYKAMAGEPVPCPICMCNVVRPTVTKCAHLFCRECISRELQRTPALGMLQAPQSKCPICRRIMKGSEMMEMKTLSEVEDAVVIDATDSSSSGGGGSGSGSSNGKGKGKGKRAANPGDSGMEEEEKDDAEGCGCGKEAAATAMATEAAGDERGAVAAAAPAPVPVPAAGASVGAAAASANGDSGASAAPAGSSAAACCSHRGGGGGGGGGGGAVAAARPRPRSPPTAGPATGLAAAAGAATASGGVGTSGVAGAGVVAAGGVEERDAGPSLVIPTFRFTPTATRAQLDGALAPPYDLPRDNTVPSLERTFLSQYRAATSSNSSVKLDALVRDMETTLQRDPASKFVIFSQYPQVVDRAGNVLRTRGIRSTSIVGGRTRVERSSAVSSFANDPSIRAILLTTGSAAAGLTLTAASTVYMLDPVWSAADEAQALNRAHRIGQTHTVRCVVFFMKDSVEERLLALRHSKGNFAQFLESADSVVSLASEGVDGSFVNMFALPELKKLFGMMGAQAAAASGQGGGGAAAGGAGSGAGGGNLSIGPIYSQSSMDGLSSTGDEDSDDDDGGDGGGGGGGGDRSYESDRAMLIISGIDSEELALARAIALSRAMWQGGSGGSGGTSSRTSGSGSGGSNGVSGSPFDLSDV
ncbi:unnamed protein product [Pylaiella littoralis]